MSVIIRLQNLPWSASSADIRRFFQGLTIPDGGVHIVGGDEGDAFIAFATDEDARQAMRLTGEPLNGVAVKLFLSSRSEMQAVINKARGAAAAQAAPQLPPHIPNLSQVQIPANLQGINLSQLVAQSPQPQTTTPSIQPPAHPTIPVSQPQPTAQQLQQIAQLLSSPQAIQLQSQLGLNLGGLLQNIVPASHAQSTPPVQVQSTPPPQQIPQPQPPPPTAPVTSQNSQTFDYANVQSTGFMEQNSRYGQWNQPEPHRMDVDRNAPESRDKTSMERRLGMEQRELNLSSMSDERIRPDRMGMQDSLGMRDNRMDFGRDERMDFGRNERMDFNRDDRFGQGRFQENPPREGRSSRFGPPEPNRFDSGERGPPPERPPPPPETNRPNYGRGRAEHSSFGVRPDTDRRPPFSGERGRGMLGDGPMPRSGMMDERSDDRGGRSVLKDGPNDRNRPAPGRAQEGQGLRSRFDQDDMTPRRGWNEGMPPEDRQVNRFQSLFDKKPEPPKLSDQTKVPSLMSQVIDLPQSQPVWGRNIPSAKKPDAPSTPTGRCVILNNMPKDIPFREVKRCFNVEVPRHGLKFACDTNNERTGIAYVRFATVADCQSALSDNRITQKDPRITIRPCSEQEFELATEAPDVDKTEAVERPGPGLGLAAAAVAGPRKESREKDDGLRRREQRSRSRERDRRDRRGSARRSRSRSPRRDRDRRDRDRGSIDRRDDRDRRRRDDDQRPEATSADSKEEPKELCLAVKGLPPKLKIQDIIDFFKGLKLITNSVYIEYDAKGIAAGPAYMEFSDREDFKKALEYDKKLLISRFVDVVPMPRKEIESRVKEHKRSLTKGRGDIIEKETQLKEIPKPIIQKEIAIKEETRMEEGPPSIDGPFMEGDRLKERDGVGNKRGLLGAEPASAGLEATTDVSEIIPDVPGDHINLRVSLGGLPWGTSEKDIEDWFEDVRICLGSMVIEPSKRGKKSPLRAFFTVETAEDLEKALVKHKDYMGKRFITVWHWQRDRKPTRAQQAEKIEGTVRGRKRPSRFDEGSENSPEVVKPKDGPPLRGPGRFADIEPSLQRRSRFDEPTPFEREEKFVGRGGPPRLEGASDHPMDESQRFDGPGGRFGGEPVRGSLRDAPPLIGDGPRERLPRLDDGQRERTFRMDEDMPRDRALLRFDDRMARFDEETRDRPPFHFDDDLRDRPSRFEVGSRGRGGRGGARDRRDFREGGIESSRGRFDPESDRFMDRPMDFDDPRAVPMDFDGPRRGRMDFDEPRGRPMDFDGPFDGPRGPLDYDDPSMDFHEDPHVGPMMFDGPRGPGMMEGPRGRFGPRGGRGMLHEYRGPRPDFFRHPGPGFRGPPLGPNFRMPFAGPSLEGDGPPRPQGPSHAPAVNPGDELPPYTFQGDHNAMPESFKNKDFHIVKVSRLPYKMPAAKLFEHFREYNPIENTAHMRVTPEGMYTGDGMLAFENKEDAERAVSERDGKVFGRKPIKAVIFRIFSENGQEL